MDPTLSHLSDAVVLAMIAAISSAITSIASVIVSLANNRNIKKVEANVKTSNAQTLAQLADAVESRRIKMIPEQERTALEKGHILNTDLQQYRSETEEKKL